MPGIDWNIQAPQWLKEAGQWQDTGGLQALQMGLQAAENQQRLGLQREQAKMNFDVHRVQMQTELLKLDAMKAEQSAWLKDAPEVAKLWAMPPGQAVDAPIFVTSKQGVQAVEKIKTISGQHVAQSTAYQDQNDFRKNMLPLSAEARTRILSMPPGPVNPTPDQWGALNTELERMGLPRAGVKAPTQSRTEQNDFIKAMEPLNAATRIKVLSMTSGPTPTPEQWDLVNTAREDMGLNRQGVPPSETMEWMDPTTGQPMYRITKGGTGKATIATQSDAQQKVAEMGNSVDLVDWLGKNLRPEDVGVRGMVGTVVVDRGLQQIAENLGKTDVINGQRVSARQALGWLSESLMRKIADDKTGRTWSSRDREAIKQMIPDTGYQKSYAEVMSNLQGVKRILTDRAMNYSNIAGFRPPDWALTRDDVARMYQGGLDAIQHGMKPTSSEFKNKFMTLEEAAAYNAAHPEPTQ